MLGRCDYVRFLTALALNGGCDMAFPFRPQGRHPKSSFSELNPPAHRSLCLRFHRYLTIATAKLEARMVSLFLSCRALSSPTICRFIPAHCPALTIPCQGVRTLMGVISNGLFQTC